MKRFKTVAYPYNLIGEIIGFEINSVISEDMINGLQYALTTLEEREQKALRLRFEERLTYAQIGEVLSVSKERSRDILNRSFRKLRHPTRKKYASYGLEYSRTLDQERERRNEQFRLEQEEIRRKEPRETLIQDLEGLSVRSFNSLQRSGLKSIGEIIDFKNCWGPEWYLRIRNFGPKSMHEVENILRLELSKE